MDPILQKLKTKLKATNFGFTMQSGGPSWAVKKGRRDSRTSTAARAAADLPPSTSTYPDLLRRFRARNLTDVDLVTLSGAHTIGSAHCAEFAGRLLGPDPSMDPDFRAHLLSACPQPAPDPEVVVFFDEATPLGFDNGFYKAVAARRGLLGSDQSVGEGMAAAVALYAANQTLFFENFAAAMDRFGEVGVLSGEEGEIRRDCLKIN